MKIRTQLVVALFLLAIMPLAGIVFFSYASSLAAVRQAVEEEASELAADMETRMSGVQQDLEQRVGRVGALPIRTLLSPEDEDAECCEKDEFVGMVLTELGEVAPLVQSFKFIPPEEIERAELEATDSELKIAAADSALELAELDVEARTVDVEEIMRRVEENLEHLPDEQRDRALEGAKAGLEAAAVIAEGVHELMTFVGARIEAQAPEVEPLHLEERQNEIRKRRKEIKAKLKKQYEVPILEEGRVVGRFQAQISGYEALHSVLARTRREQGEIPFALDEEGNLFTVSEEDREDLEELNLPLIFAAVPAEEGISAQGVLEDWVLVTERDPETGLTFGIARPIRESLAEIRQTAARNFGYGMGLIGLALIGILPLSRRMTQGVREVIEGAQRIAHGDLDTRVTVRSQNEIGQLAQAFNRMAHDLKEHQELLVEEERRRRDQEVQQQLLKASYERKTAELEEARRFQLSLLPRELPKHPTFELAVHMRTATEVGGDYYDFRLGDDGTLVCAVGDATGHGAKAGTMVTVIKSLFSAYPSDASLCEFLGDANRAIRRMELGRMAMALSLAKLEGRTLTLSMAGMPPALLYREASRTVEELAVEGLPLGSLDHAYRESKAGVAPGDVLLLMSDGFPELLNGEGEPFGYVKVREAFEKAATGAPRQVITSLAEAAVSWAGEQPPNDDVTFVVLQVRQAGGAP